MGNKYQINLKDEGKGRREKQMKQTENKYSSIYKHVNNTITITW